MRQKYDKGMSVKESGFKHKGKLEKEYKKIVGEDRKFREPKDALFALERADVGVKFVDGLEKKGINVEKIKGDILKEKMKSKEFRIGIAKGKTKASDDDDKKYRVYKKGGKASKMPSKNPMAEDRVKEAKKDKYRKMGFGKMMDKGEIKFAKGGRTGYSVGGRAMRGVSKILMKK